MNHTEYIIYITSLITKYSLKTISDKEKEELRNWIHQSEENQEMFLHLLSNISADYKTKAWVSPYRKQSIWSKIEKNKEPKSTTWNYMKYAAVACLLLIVGIALYTVRPKHIVVSQVEAKTVPVLVTEDGSEYNLEDKMELQMSNAVYKSNNSSLEYKHQVNNQAKQKPQYNTLITPKGMTYKLKLADGTRVHLNSQSKLKYPVYFVGNLRQVELEGEALFEVTKQKGKGFEVVVGNTKIDVLGTVFNVTAYKDQHSITTTLVEGRVDLVNSNLNLRKKIQPNQQIKINNTTGNFVLKQVDTRAYTAWVHNKIAFENESLDNIVHKLGRIYELGTVQFESEDLKKIRFTGEMRKYKELNTCLDKLQQTKKVKFSIQDDILIVSKY